MSETILRVTAHLTNKMRPMDRGERFEDPLQELLERTGAGEITGGGTGLTDQGEVAFCELEIALHRNTEASRADILAQLEKCGAARGSHLILEDGHVSFGQLEGLGLYLNGTELPDEVYEECDVNVVYEEVNRLLAGVGEIHSYWEGPRDTALYAYGTSFAEMQAKLRSFLDTYPLCQQCRVTQVA